MTTATITPGNPEKQDAVGRPMVLLLAATVGLVVGNLYYIQPLLGLIAADLSLTQGQVGGAATLSMVGQTVGMLLVMPLGDIFDRRPLIIGSVAVSVLSLLAVGVSSSFVWLCIACTVLGLATTGTHMTVSLAASLASPEQRGRVVGTVVGGLLTGLLLSRTVSGVLGANLGWRAIYFIAAAALSILCVVLWRFLPRTVAGEKMRYSKLLLSMASLIRHQPVLRESCVFGSMTFAAFAAFWMTLAFHLEAPPLGHGSDVAGLMGLLALVGALAAGSVGRLTDRFSARAIVGVFLVLTLVSFGWLYFTRLSLLGLGIGVVLMDLGVQAVHVGSQSRVYSLIPEARNRLGTIYIVTYFAGGAAGSAAGVWGWTHYGWLGVCASGAAFALVATLWFLVGSRTGLLNSRS